MGVVADRTCPSCGADVSSASGFCPRCGADLEARLIELGGGTPAGTRPRRLVAPDHAGTRLLAGVAAVVVGGLAVTTLVGDDGDDGRAPTAADGRAAHRTPRPRPSAT